MRGASSLSSIVQSHRKSTVAASLLLIGGMACGLIDMAFGEWLSPPRGVLAGLGVVLTGGALAMLRGGYAGLKARAAEVDAAQNKLFSAINRDALTGAFTRAFFIEKMLEHVYHGAPEPAGYLQVDMDNLKIVNDTNGHASGDAALVHLIATLRNTAPEAIIGRLGGDEFGALLPGVGDKQALMQLGKELLRSLDEPFYHEGRRVRLSATIGLACAPQDSSDTSELISQADLALYAGKREGRHAVVAFDPEMLGEERHRRFVERELRAAILMNDLELAYQPVMRSSDRTVLSYEALVRWRHPVRGMIAPLDFVPVAEKSDLIHLLGDWVLRRACSDFQRLNTGAVAINVSPAQLRRPDFAEAFEAIIKESAIDPRAVIIEITESVPLLAKGAELENLARLRALGARVAIDDFGAGHASLYYLRGFAFDIIKIDRAYVSNIAEKSVDRMIVTAICTIARGLGVMVIAEGVETHEQAQVLSECGCDVMQGYLFARPQRLSDILRAGRDIAAA
ncbi:hypothetical protein GCM10007989_21920 [Devosia pacifica]|uniref:Diguanylate cyclase (GGDEF)-like protein n=1 Tax=Devosia pacifica TaxID=1335967 RepID=A0A918S7P4_9HYPH|nr:bifunctional diguanylate cyclase/phosphodiesterase [Devosia pacifica]GHA25837.1 hypothetical protein GCM10007989_21920 [Devosia pacifica]